MLTYNLTQRKDESKYYYIYKSIRRDIEGGTLKKGEKLPSKRSLAEHLGVSLITIENAYQMLKDEGYIEPRERSGYYVCEIHATISEAAGSERQLHMLPEQIEYIEDGRLPDTALNTFPYSLYFKTVRSVITQYGEELLHRSPNEGCAILRNSIASYLLRYRGVLHNRNRLLLVPEQNIYMALWFGFWGVTGSMVLKIRHTTRFKKVYEGTGAACELLQMDENGIKTELLQSTSASVLHVTPFHSYPSGVTAPIAKRYEYLAWAGRENRYIVEDDFDSEFFMPGKPIETLFMLDSSHSVIYINTFSKSLSPSIRMGYMILPQRLLKRYHETSGGFSCTVPVLEQYALAEFINKGYFEQHLNRVRRQRKM